MDGLKIMLIFASLALLSAVCAAPSGLSETRSSDVAPFFELDDSQPTQSQENKLSDEYNSFLRDLLRRHGQALASYNLQGSDQVISPRDDPVKRMAWKLCLPGTDCDFGDMADEADAKEFLKIGADTNPGRRRKRSADQKVKIGLTSNQVDDPAFLPDPFRKRRNVETNVETKVDTNVIGGDVDVVCDLALHACREFIRKLGSIHMRRYLA